MLFHVEHNWWARGLNKPDIVAIDDSIFSNLGYLFKYGGQTIWLAPEQVESTPSLKVDRIIVSDSEMNDWNAILEVTRPTQIVVGQNLKYKELKRLRSACEELKIEFYQCKESGPLIL